MDRRTSAGEQMDRSKSSSSRSSCLGLRWLLRIRLLRRFIRLDGGLRGFLRRFPTGLDAAVGRALVGAATGRLVRIGGLEPRGRLARRRLLQRSTRILEDVAELVLELLEVALARQVEALE